MNGLHPSAVALGCLLACWCGRAAASDLSWSGPPECRESEQLSFQVQRALGAPLADTGHVHLQVHIERVIPDARALLRIASDGSAAQEVRLKERLLVAPDCATLVDTLAVAIALAVEAAAPVNTEQARAPVAPGPSVPAVRESPPAAGGAAPLVSDAVSAAPGADERSELVPSVAALLVADAGSLPHAAFGPALGLQLGGSSWRLELLGTFWLQQHGGLGAGSLAGAGAEVSLATGALLGCADPLGSGARALRLSLCAGGELGRLSATGTGVNRPRNASALWVAPSLQALLSYRLPATRLSLEARAGGALPLQRDEFVLDGLGTVHQPASLVARAGVGIAVAFE